MQAGRSEATVEAGGYLGTPHLPSERLHQVRDLDMFTLAIDSKLRGCELVNLRVRDVTLGNQILARAKKWLSSRWDVQRCPEVPCRVYHAASVQSRAQHRCADS